jgi:cytochrome P450
MRQLDTATLMISAGFETTGFTIETAVYHLLTTPSLWFRLKQELVEAWPDEQDMPYLATLEKLPYLKAVVQESLRLSIGVMARLPRINRSGSMTCGEWVIPKDTHVSMSQKDILLNADIFPNPDTFDPERWMEGEESVRLSKHLVSFSKGARRCLGMKYVELSIICSHETG